jgi:hypothetical protein
MMGLIYQFRTKEAEALAQQQTAAIKTTAAGRVIDWGKITVFDEAL